MSHNSKITKILKQYAIIALGTAFLALGVNQFLVPLKISSGGISTIATIFLYLFRIPLSVTNLVLCAVLFVFAFKYLGKAAVAKTVAGILFLSFFLEVFTHFPVYSGDMVAATLLGGTLSGIGVGLVVREGASTGGSDFAGLMLNKLMPHISIALIILVIDCITVITSGIVFHSLTITIYSIAALYISAKITDLVTIAGNKAKFAFIISVKYKEIADDIIIKHKRGITGIYCKGMYTDEEKTMLLCVVSPKEMPQLVKIAKEYDEAAFIMVSDAREVMGKGFKEV